MIALTPVALDAEHAVRVGPLPPALAELSFDALWHLHPAVYHRIRMMGREVDTPRWQQAYGRDYRYTGRVNEALPLTPVLQQILDAVREIDGRLNGLLLNWYDGERGHYIGRHRDSDAGRVPGSPVVTLSFGAPRSFRFRPYRGEGFVDLDTGEHPVVVFEWATNRAFTHEVPRGPGRRVSVTARAFL